jgi:hypothetical protein
MWWKGGNGGKDKLENGGSLFLFESWCTFIAWKRDIKYVEFLEINEGSAITSFAFGIS